MGLHFIGNSKGKNARAQECDWHSKYIVIQATNIVTEIALI